MRGFPNSFVICFQCPRAKLRGNFKRYKFCSCCHSFVRGPLKTFSSKSIFSFSLSGFQTVQRMICAKFSAIWSNFYGPNFVNFPFILCLPGWISSSCVKGSQPSKLPDWTKSSKTYHISWKVWLQWKKSEEIVFSRTVGMTWKKNSAIWPS